MKIFWALRMPHPYLACLGLLKDKEPHVSLSPPIIPCLTIRIHVFLIITQDVIGGDKDFKIFSFSPYQHTGKRKSFENFVACPYL